MICLASFFIRILRLERLIDLFPQTAQNLLRCASHVGFFNVTRARKSNRELLLDSSRTKRQQRHTIAEPHRFADVMSDEDNRAPGLSPDTLQFIVEQVT